MKDEEIVSKVKSGDADQYGEIVKRYEAAMFRYIKRVVNQGNEEVEDLVQETFISAYENIMGFEEKHKFSSWIFRIAHNKCIDYFRKRKIKTTTVEDKEELIESNEKLIEELEIEKENKIMVHRAVEKLELKYKEVVLLYFFEDKSYEEISDILHIQTSNVGVILKRGKEKLRKILNSLPAGRQVKSKSKK